MPTTSSESRRRRKDYDRDRQSSKDHETKPREAATTATTATGSSSNNNSNSNSSRKRSSSSAVPSSQQHSKQSHRKSSSKPSSNTSSGRSGSKRAIVVPEMDRRPSIVDPPSEPRSPAIPYPSFSRAHSKEAVGSRDNLVNPRRSPYTPDPTILSTDDAEPQGGSAAGRSASPDKVNSRGATTRHASAGAAIHPEGPPSPPLTAHEPELRRPKSGNSIGVSASPVGRSKEKHARPSSMDGASMPRSRARSVTSTSTLRKDHIDPRPPTSILSSSSIGPTGPSSRISYGTSDVKSQGRSVLTADSQATPVPIPRPAFRPGSLPRPTSPISTPDSSPKTPNETPNFSNIPGSAKHAHVTEVFDTCDTTSPTYPPPIDVTGNVTSPAAPPPRSMVPGIPPPPPPPPPPPAMQAVEQPRVDYLLQNGGLSRILPRSFLIAGQALQGGPPTYQSTPFSSPNMPRIYSAQPRGINVFSPLSDVLDEYLQVFSKNGSIAVATGYRSVARRLLDRLEAVFNRNISSEKCECIMCLDAAELRAEMKPQEEEEESGVSWGEILEYVSGRKELPAWPPFSISADGFSQTKASEAPMQKLDIDVPEEYRDHYIRQSKKTKNAVQAWLASQPEIPSSPPQEVDDETLVFAVITHLEPQNRRLFTALLRGMSTLPASRAPTPMEMPKSIVITRTAHALQRLYRLSSLPRDAECSIFLLKNPHLHGILATLAAISSQEWDILVSGRFDGFLWSGAEGVAAVANANAMPPRLLTPLPSSRTTTPFRPTSAGPPGTPFSAAGIPSRAQTPAPPAFGAPVQMDEESEIAALAEVEREIYAGMEALEDAFENLHCKAEKVRDALRARAAGLSIAASARRGSQTEQPVAMSGTPFMGGGQWTDYDADDGLDVRSELAPDDSASNISFHRNRRRRRRPSRRDNKTPMVVEEEEEEGADDTGRDTDFTETEDESQDNTRRTTTRK